MEVRDLRMRYGCLFFYDEMLLLTIFLFPFHPSEKHRDNCSLNSTVSYTHVLQVPVALRSSASPKYPKPSMPTPPPPPRRQLLEYSPLPPRNGPSIKSLANAKLDLPIVSPATTEKHTLSKKTVHKFQMMLTSR